MPYDGIALPLVWLTQLLGVLSIWSSFTAIKQQTRSYYALMLLLQAAMTGVFVSMDLLLFYIFFEFTLIPLFLIVGIWGGSQRRFAAFKLFIYTMAGGVLTFIGIIFIAVGLIIFPVVLDGIASVLHGTAGAGLSSSYTGLGPILRVTPLIVLIAFISAGAISGFFGIRKLGSGAS